MTVLYYYIVSPRYALIRWINQSITHAVFWALLLLSFFLVGVITPAWGFKLVFWMVVLTSVFGCHAFLLDVIAQLLGYPTRFLAFLQWHILTFLPVCLWVPFQYFFEAYPVLNIGRPIVIFGILGLVLVRHIETVWFFYRPRRFHLVLILLFPISFFGLITFAIILYFSALILQFL